MLRLKPGWNASINVDLTIFCSCSTRKQEKYSVFVRNLPVVADDEAISKDKTVRLLHFGRKYWRIPRKDSIIVPTEELNSILFQEVFNSVNIACSGPDKSLVMISLDLEQGFGLASCLI